MYSQRPSSHDSGISSCAYSDDSTLTVPDSFENTYYRHFHGRRFCGFGKHPYLLPNDYTEQRCWDQLEDLRKLVSDDKMFLSPLSNSHGRVLDIGTGTGRWPINLADRYPQLLVTGVDVSPIQPTLVPPNVSFEIFDVEDDWTFRHPWDMIRLGGMNKSIVNWKELIQRSYTALAPGSWIELIDIEPGLFDEGSNLISNRVTKFTGLLTEGLVNLGRTVPTRYELASLLQDQGFEMVDIIEKRAPFGTWPKDRGEKFIGRSYEQVFIRSRRGSALKAFLQGHNWTSSQLRHYLKNVRRSCKRDQQARYCLLYVVLGRKPVTS